MSPSIETAPAGAAPVGVRSRHAAALVALVVGACAMGVSPVFVRHAEVGPFASAFWRVAAALPVLGLWFLYEVGPARAWRTLAAAFGAPVLWLCGAIFAGDLLFWHLSILNTTMANATFLATLAPVWVALGSRLFIGEPVERRVLAGLAVCVLGGVILLGGSYTPAR
jgi:drug/metabolite transporter (DMT)-like permease